MVNGLASPTCYSFQTTTGRFLRHRDYQWRSPRTTIRTGDTWHIAYHRFVVPAGNGTNRETTVDRMEFNADGTIRPVVPTL